MDSLGLLWPFLQLALLCQFPTWFPSSNSGRKIVSKLERQKKKKKVQSCLTLSQPDSLQTSKFPTTQTMGWSFSFTKGDTFGPSKCWVPLGHVKHSWIASSGTDDKKGSRSKVPGQLLSQSDSLCRDLVSKPRPCAHIMPYWGYLWSHRMAAYPRTPGFNKPRHPGVDVSAGTGKPSDLLVGHTQPLSLLLC